MRPYEIWGIQKSFLLYEMVSRFKDETFFSKNHIYFALDIDDVGQRDCHAHWGNRLAGMP